MQLFFFRTEHNLSTDKLGAYASGSKNGVSFSIFNDEKPSKLLVILFSIVFGLHVCGIMYWLATKQNLLIQAKPLLMEVAMIVKSSPKPSVAPPAPMIAQQPVIKPEPIKPQQFSL